MHRGARNPICGLGMLAIGATVACGRLLAVASDEPGADPVPDAGSANDSSMAKDSSTLADGGADAAGDASEGLGCQQPGDHCVNPAGGYCSTDRKCLACAPNEKPCANAFECCSHVCRDLRCAPEPACVTSGSPCAPGRCCPGLECTTGGTCLAPSNCAAAQACVDDLRQCCSDSGTTGGGVCGGTATFVCN